MKQTILFLCFAFLAACTTDPKPPRATFASVETPFTKPLKRAANVGQTSHGVCAYYLDTDTEFCLYFNQCCTLGIDGKIERLDCEVYQTSPGVWVADFGNGEFCKVNTVTGTTTIFKGGVNRVYRKVPTP